MKVANKRGDKGDVTKVYDKAKFSEQAVKR